GLDLVKEQLRIAAGESLGYGQEDVRMDGHALELRVYAEDPRNGFAPDIGQLKVYRRPSGEGVRVDDGIEEGMDIPIFYDPMIAKLVVHGTDRTDAISKMLEAIERYVIIGVETTLPFGRFVLEHEAFVSGEFDTHFVQTYFEASALPTGADHDLAAALAQYRRSPRLEANPAPSAWRRR
ncbi:MAG: biotin carboxylase, partial [Flavobacteriia bacterium]|nr:biotin carboxylase [Flavobacteriia bacterium]